MIYDPDDELSNKLAHDGLDSCRSFNIDVELIKGVFGSEIDLRMTEFNLTVSKECLDMSKGNKGCFLSHYLLWKKCIELNEPILVFEHDMIIKHEISDSLLDTFTDYLNLDYCSSFRKNPAKYLECMKMNQTLTVKKLFEKYQIPKTLTWKSAKTFHVVGTHGYIIKPSGATKLINAAHNNGIMPVDVHINCHYVDIFVTNPSLIRTCDFMLDKKNSSKFSRTKNYEPGTREIPW